MLDLDQAIKDFARTECKASVPCFMLPNPLCSLRREGSESFSGAESCIGRARIPPIQSTFTTDTSTEDSLSPSPWFPRGEDLVVQGCARLGTGPGEKHHHDHHQPLATTMVTRTVAIAANYSIGQANARLDGKLFSVSGRDTMLQPWRARV